MLEQILCDGDGTCMYMSVCKKEKKMQKSNAKTSINQSLMQGDVMNEKPHNQRKTS